MKKNILALIFLGIIPLDSNSQKRINDTIIDNVAKYRVTDFGAQINSGVTKYFFDSRAEKYFGNYWGPALRLNFYYQNFILGFSFRPAILNIKDTLFFDAYLLPANQDFHLINGNIFLGYKIDLPEDFSCELYLGSLMTHYSLAYYASAHQTRSFAFESSNGYTFGVSINKYFEVLPAQYLVVFLNGNMNKPNYHKTNSDLGSPFYAVEFGLAYKGWFKKKIK